MSTFAYAIGEEFKPWVPSSPFTTPPIPSVQPFPSAPVDLARATQVFFDLTAAYNAMRERAETAEKELAALKAKLRELGA